MRTGEELHLQGGPTVLTKTSGQLEEGEDEQGCSCGFGVQDALGQHLRGDGEQAQDDLLQDVRGSDDVHNKGSSSETSSHS